MPIVRLAGRYIHPRYRDQQQLPAGFHGLGMSVATPPPTKSGGGGHMLPGGPIQFTSAGPGYGVQFSQGGTQFSSAGPGWGVSFGPKPSMAQTVKLSQGAPGTAPLPTNPTLQRPAPTITQAQGPAPRLSTISPQPITIKLQDAPPAPPGPVGAQVVYQAEGQRPPASTPNSGATEPSSGTAIPSTPTPPTPQPVPSEVGILAAAAGILALLYFG